MRDHSILHHILMEYINNPPKKCYECLFRTTEDVMPKWVWWCTLLKHPIDGYTPKCIELDFTKRLLEVI